jgi:ADP-heptose:LPS heptosyltransferase
MEIRKVGNPIFRAALRAASHLVLLEKRAREGLRGRRASSAPPARIALFASMELLGGGVMISAMVKALKQRYPSAEVHVVGEAHRSARLEEFFTRHSWVDSVIVCPRRGSPSLTEWWAFYRMLKARRFDLGVLSPNHSCSNSVFLYLCGISELLGAYLPLTWTWHAWVEHQFLTQRMTVEQIGAEPYRQLYFPQAYVRRILGDNQAQLATLVPYVRFQDEGRPELPRDRPIVAIHAGGHPEKRSTPECFAVVARRLVERFDASLLLLGGEPERELSESIRASVLEAHPRARVLNGCGSSMNRTLTWVSHCDLFVGNNAGPMHLAVALGIPVVGAFRERDRWFGGPDAVSPIHCTVGAETAAQVAPDDVWQAIVSRTRDGRPLLAAPVAAAAGSLP